MVALSPRFAVLAAFISLASLSTSPLSVGAVAIPKTQENSNTARFFDHARVQRAFRLSQAKAVKRDEFDCGEDDLICIGLLGQQILPRASHWALRKNGKSYSVSPKHKQKHLPKKHPKHNAHVGRRETQAGAGTGTIDIVSPSAKSDDGKTLGHLYVEKPDNQQKPEGQQKSATSESYPVEFSSTKSTVFTLVEGSGAATGDGETMKFVRIQASRPREAMAAGETGPAELCMTYDTLKTSGLFMAPCVDETGTGNMKQTFGYDQTTQNVTPLQDTPKDPNGAAQGVLARDDEPKDVVLKFNPTRGDASAADVAEPSAAEPSNAASPTSTMTKTVTVTNTPAASMSAADVAATPSANTSSSSVASLTSTSKGAAPTAGPVGTSGTAGTAGVAGVMDVQVVQPSSASSAMLSASSAASSAAPTTTMNAQDVAASVASSSTAAPTAATPASAVVSPSASSVAAAPSSVSSSAPSSAPNVRAIRTEPYKWVFRRE